MRSTWAKLNQLKRQTAGRTSRSGGPCHISSCSFCSDFIITCAARMYMAANPFSPIRRARAMFVLPTSTAITASMPCEAGTAGTLSITPPSAQVRPPTTAGGKKPGRAHEA
jgi:hypothetical protein